MSDQKPPNKESKSTRRNFVKKASIGTAALGLSPLVFPSISAAEGATKKKLKVGVVGLGGRGTGAVSNILSADPDTILWAVGDIFEDRMKKVEGYREKVLRSS